MSEMSEMSASAFSEEYTQLNKTSIELKSRLEKLQRDYKIEVELNNEQLKLTNDQTERPF